MNVHLSRLFPANAYPVRLVPGSVVAIDAIAQDTECARLQQALHEDCAHVYQLHSFLRGAAEVGQSLATLDSFQRLNLCFFAPLISTTEWTTSLRSCRICHIHCKLLVRTAFSLCWTPQIQPMCCVQMWFALSKVYISIGVYKMQPSLPFEAFHARPVSSWGDVHYCHSVSTLKCALNCCVNMGHGLFISWLCVGTCLVPETGHSSMWFDWWKWSCWHYGALNVFVEGDFEQSGNHQWWVRGEWTSGSHQALNSQCTKRPP